MKLLNFSNALTYFKKKVASLEGQFELVNENYINDNRYAIIHIAWKKYLVTFKREFYMTFGREFDNEKGIGETINRRALKYAAKNKAKVVVFVHEDGKIYWIYISDILEKGHLRKTEAENKEVYSFNVDYLTNYEKVLPGLVK